MQPIIPWEEQTCQLLVYFEWAEKIKNQVNPPWMTYQNANKSSHLQRVAAYKESTVFPQLPFSQKYIKYISEKMFLKLFWYKVFVHWKLKFHLTILLFFDIPFIHLFRVRRSWMSQNTTVTYIIAVVKLLLHKLQLENTVDSRQLEPSITWTSR